MKFHKLGLAVVLVGVVSLGLVACGSNDSKNSAATIPAATIPTGADFNKADVEFAQGMIPHHEQAVEMSDMALRAETGASDSLKRLATRIKAAQDPEIVQMKSWLTKWGQPLDANVSNGHDMGSMNDDSSMMGMMSDKEMGSLRGSMGMDFDKMWLAMMIKHHEGAIEMAKVEIKDGSNADAKTLANAIITAQEREIVEMKAMLAA